MGRLDAAVSAATARRKGQGTLLAIQPGMELLEARAAVLLKETLTAWAEAIQGWKVIKMLETEVGALPIVIQATKVTRLMTPAVLEYHLQLPA